MSTRPERRQGLAAASELASVFDGWDVELDLGAATTELARQWFDDLYPERQGEWRLRPLGARKAVEDSPARLMAVDREGLPRAIVFVSAPKSPCLVARGAERASTAADLLGAEFGASVLRPSRTGLVGNLSIAAYPWRLEVQRGAFRSRFQRPFVRAWALNWLRGVTKICASRYSEPSSVSEARGLLETLATCKLLGDEVRSMIDRACARLESGMWRPRCVLDHNDFWPGNIMVNRDQFNRQAGASPNVIIDWAGANLRGGGFVDLARAARGFDLSKRRVREEVAAHCQLLAIAPEDAVSQALLSLAYLLQNIECFPPESFSQLTSRTVACLRRAIV